MLLLRWALPLFVGLAALLVFPRAGHPTTVLTPTLAELVARASRIIVGDVVDVRAESEQTREGPIPVTLVTVRTLRTLKGAPGVQLVLEFLGGTVDNHTLQVFDLPRFRVGDREVLFLKHGGRAISPLVGLMHGRFRVAWNGDLQAESIASHNGRPLVDGDLFRPQSKTASGTRPLSLESFEREILNRVRQPDGLLAREVLPAFGDDSAVLPTTIGETSERASSAPASVQLDLGPSPALLNGCPDWSCVVQKALSAWQPLLSPARHPTVTEPLERPGTDRGLELKWVDEVHGRPLDDDTLAVTIRRVDRHGHQVTVAFNRSLSWNAYDGPVRRSQTGQLLFDFQRVVTRELSHVLGVDSPQVQGGDSSHSPLTARTSAADNLQELVQRVSPGTRTLVIAREGLNAGCDSGAVPGVLVDPRVLLFESPDHSMMTSYEVGAFLSGAASPSRVVNLPPGAFAQRPVLGLAVTGPQRLFVVSIRAAELTTPVGVIHEYRVRGVWPGGRTEWSGPSQPFVTCR